jgi:hypothetical protein
MTNTKYNKTDFLSEPKDNKKNLSKAINFQESLNVMGWFETIFQTSPVLP